MRARFRLVLGFALAASLMAFPASAAPGHNQIPSAVPAATSPAINDGQVNSIVQVGDTVIAGGTFTSVTGPGGAATPRSGVVAFDASTGALRTFNPALNGAVEDVLAGPTADSVYVGGSFTTLNGAATSHVALLNVNTGAPVAGFKAVTTNGAVNALTKTSERLYIGGNFTTAGGVAHKGLASLKLSTGAIDAFMDVNVADRHNDTGSGAQGAVGVRDMEATPDGSKMIVIGNFKHADGLNRDQAAVLNLRGGDAAVDANWHTQRYQPYCFNWAFDTYMRGVSVSPDGTYFVITATGGQNSGTLCDTAARFEFSATGDDIQPTWIDYSGGDTLWGVDITEKAVFVGGHQRWMNNSDASDFAGQGAVARPGLAALDVESGIPLTWNPGRNPRGAGAYSVFASSTGLWVGSDTDWIGNRKYKRPHLAYFPLAGGAPQSTDTAPSLPGSVYLGGPQTVSQGNVLYRVNAGGAQVDSVDGGPAWIADEAGDSSLRNSGSNGSGWGSGASSDATVPASTPSAVFDSERWSPSDNPPMSWSFPATAGVPLQVRLFFANRCSCTSASGSRSFDVSLDGVKVLNSFDIVAAVGDQRGTMRAFNITSDGTVNIDFGHVVENPLVNAIEIVRTDQAPPAPPSSTLSTIAFDGTTADPAVTGDARGIDWGKVRGAFMVGDTLYYGTTDGMLFKRKFTPSTTGPAISIDPYNDPIWADVDTGSGNTYRGKAPDLYGQFGSLTGMFYANDRLFYTLSGRTELFWRWFDTDSAIVGSQVFTANGGRAWSDTAGLFRDDGTLYVVSRSTGNLSKIAFTDDAPAGALTTVDSSQDWRARATFIGPGNKAPTASFATSCTERTCQVNGTGSTDPDGTISSYAWSFGDGGSATGSTASHLYAADGSFTITLTVTDSDGATASTTKTVDVAATPPPASTINFVGRGQVSLKSTNPTVPLPAGLQAGDRMVLVGSYAVDAPAPATPPGWELVSTRAATGMASFVWTRAATAGDIGGSVSTATATSSNAALTVAAYRGVATTNAISALASSTDGGTASHVSPTAAAPAGGWVVQVWTDKSSATTAWTAPAGVAVRGSVFGTGGGRASALLVDSGDAVTAGSYGQMTASTDAPSGRAIAWTITLKGAS